MANGPQTLIKIKNKSIKILKKLRKKSIIWKMSWLMEKPLNFVGLRSFLSTQKMKKNRFCSNIRSKN
jgi:hypothetical protein